MSPWTSIAVIRVAVMDSPTIHVRQAFVATEKTARRWPVPNNATVHHRAVSGTIRVAQLHDAPTNPAAGRNGPGTRAATVDSGPSMKSMVLINNRSRIRRLRMRRAAAAV